MGFTAFLVYRSARSAVHPHVCGVYAGSTGCQNGKPGSSPRMWGLLLGWAKNNNLIRFIPTYVGFTTTGPGTSSFSTVHPHVCGVYTLFASMLGSACGSSPRMWGLQHRENKFEMKQRFIPTYVGFTLKRVKKNMEIPSDFLPISSKKFQTEFLALVVIDGATAFLTRMIFPAPRHSEPPVGTVPHR